MTIENDHQLRAHPKLGASFEGFALDHVCRSLGKNDNEYYFYNVHSGSELDLFWQQQGKNWGAEFKYADAPRLTRSMSVVIKDLDLTHLFVIYPGKKIYRLAENITVLPLGEDMTIGNE